ncbi:MAG: gamma carbonic anhydrase family protein [Myxococcales bacterium]|nr:gamma carbonic anhydrase family protein [Myxococcales bacterium]
MANLYEYEGVAPTLGKGVWLAPTATIIGRATLGDEVSVWFGAVVRADQLAIEIGARTNIQDNAVVHITQEAPIAPGLGTRIGAGVTVGHGAIVHACSIGDHVLVGMGSIVLDGAKIGNDVIIAAGTVVPPGMVVPDGMVVMGNPGRIKGPVTDDKRFWSHTAAGLYVGYAQKFRGSGIG